MGDRGEFHYYNEQRDNAAFEQMQSRSVGQQQHDPRKIHDFEASEQMKDSVDTSRWNSSQVRHDKTQQQMISARHMKHNAY